MWSGPRENVEDKVDEVEMFPVALCCQSFLFTPPDVALGSDRKKVMTDDQAYTMM